MSTILSLSSRPRTCSGGNHGRFDVRHALAYFKFRFVRRPPLDQPGCVGSTATRSTRICLFYSLPVLRASVNSRVTANRGCQVPGMSRTCIAVASQPGSPASRETSLPLV
jgi:hypothetical protein